MKKKKIAQNYEKAQVFLSLLRLLAPDLPEPVAEYRFHPVRRWRFDYAWPAWHIAVEVDGGTYQSLGGRHNTDKDREKTNMAAAMGWRALHFTYSMLENDPGACIDVLRLALTGNTERTD